MFEKFTSFSNLHTAYRDARRSKRYRPEILKFGCMLEMELPRLRDELLGNTYLHGGYRTFIVNDSKKRIIQAAPFRDRVVHHALCNVIEPVFERVFIHDSYACRRKKGTHAAVRRVRNFLQSIRSFHPSHVYCLQCDISKYFASVRHDTLLSLLSERIHSPMILRICEKVIRSVPSGIPIGNLTSQLFANVYLHELDTYVKRELHGRYYVRYMDDFVLFDSDVKKLHTYREYITSFLKDRLELNIHEKKSSVYSLENGIDFLGYRIFSHHIELRRSTIKRRKRKLRDLFKRNASQDNAREMCVACIVNWNGYTKHAKSWMTVSSMKKTLLENKNVGDDGLLVGNK